MIRGILTIILGASLVFGAGCRSSSCQTQRNNAKLIAGNYDFGKKKETKKYKKQNRCGY
jgi:hypothetical protein